MKQNMDDLKELEELKTTYNLLEQRLDLPAFIAQHSAVDGHDGAVLAEQRPDGRIPFPLLSQIVCVPTIQKNAFVL